VTQREIDDAEWRDAANWRLGIFYCSRRDSRPFVPQHPSGLGATINFARPLGVGFLCGALAFAALLVLAASST
jgi:uncharacterized membrane protein